MRTSSSSASRARRRRRSRCTSATSATRLRTCPIVRGIEPPRELFEIDRAKIVGLTIDAERLSEIRQVRARLMRLSKSAYSELVEIYEELEHAAAIHRQLGCPVVDVSELSIEETAQRVLRIVERRKAARLRAREGEGTGSDVALGAVVCADGSRARPLLRGLPPGLARDPHRAAVRADAFAQLTAARSLRLCGKIRVPMTYVYDFDDRSGTRQGAAGRQRRRARRDDPDRRSGPGRLHDHDRRLPRVHGRGKASPRRARGRDRRARRRGSRSAPARASATRAIRCSSPSAPVRRSRCRG